MSITILRPSPGKKFANADETELYSALILSPGDSIDNYHEVDELTEIIIEEEPIIEDESYEDPDDLSGLELSPDEHGRISYEDAERILSRMTMLTNRVIELTDKVDGIPDDVGTTGDELTTEEFFNILLGVE